MFGLSLTLVCCIAAPGAGPAGTVQGTVVRATDGTGVADAEVILRVLIDGRWVPAAAVIADQQGRFCFDDLPVDPQLVYIPGANCQGIHYPGPRIRLSAARAQASATIRVHGGRTGPSPLIIREQRVVIRTAPGKLTVTETLRIDNPTEYTYLGQPVVEGHRPITLALAIPSNFERCTFDREFYGRRFSAVNSRLVTDIPWTPGLRELTFTYVMENDQPQWAWQRTIDLPCEHLVVIVETEDPQEVSWNVNQKATRSVGRVRFESIERTLPVDSAVCVRLRHLPVPLSAYTPWLGLAGLLVSIGVTSVVLLRRRPDPRSRA